MHKKFIRDVYAMGADQLCSNCIADHRLCFRYSDRTIRNSKLLFPAAVQPGLCHVWSKTQTDGFLMRRLIFLTKDEQYTATHLSINNPSQEQGTYD